MVVKLELHGIGVPRRAPAGPEVNLHHLAGIEAPVSARPFVAELHAAKMKTGGASTAPPSLRWSPGLFETAVHSGG